MLFSSILLICLFDIASSRHAKYTLSGILKCKGKPVASQEVALKFTHPLYNSKTATTVTTHSDGSFNITSATKGHWKDAYGWVEHNCDEKNRLNCDIMSEIVIPKKFMGRIYGIGDFELSKHVYYNSCDDEDE
ncbi:hypothetical protein V3C99_010814 [Haemonchus contortus]